MEDIDVTPTIHHTDTVSIAIGCSYRPIALDIKDIINLFEVLVRTELNLAKIVEDCSGSDPTVVIPSYRTWITKMWHFGVDGIDEYSGKEVKRNVYSKREVQQDYVKTVQIASCIKGFQ